MEGSETVGNCKELIRRGEGIPPDKQHLVFKGKKLEDGRAMVPPLCIAAPREDTWRLHASCWWLRTRKRPSRTAPPYCSSQLTKGSWRWHTFCCRPMRTRTRSRRMAAPVVHSSSERAAGGCTPFAGEQCGQGQGHAKWRHPIVHCSSEGGSWRLRHRKAVHVAPGAVFARVR